MTLILAASYEDGIIALADRACHERTPEGLKLECLCKKLRSLWEGNGFVGIAGKVLTGGKQLTVEAIVRQIESYPQQPIDAAKTFIQRENKEDYNENGKELTVPIPKRAYIFGIKSDNFSIYIRDLANLNLVQRSFCWFGKSYYPEVQDFLAQNYLASLTPQALTDLLRQAMTL